MLLQVAAQDIGQLPYIRQRRLIPFVPTAVGHRGGGAHPGGRFLAIRGNSYWHSLDVFEFPSLRRVLATDLDPRRADISHEELAEWFGAWPRHNIAFGAKPHCA